MDADLACQPVLINDPQKFDQMLSQIKEKKRLAVDTESNSLYAYEESVCLLQISSKETDFVVDTLTGLPISDLAPIFEDSLTEKIFHAAEYDVICLKRDFGFTFNNLFDTMHAARVLGKEKLGLAAILEDSFGVNQGRSFQKADWGKRPLRADMLTYACMDTHFLFSLRDIYHTRLVEAGRLELAQEDFARLCAVEPNHHKDLQVTQINGYHTLTSQELRILDELCSFRDQMARKLDRPHFKVIGNQALLRIAQVKPVTKDQLITIKGISPRVAERYALGLLQAVKRGLSLPEFELPRHRRPSQDYINRLEALKQWRKRAAAKMRVQSDIVLPRDVMETIAKVNPRESQALKQAMHSVPWRFSNFGDEIMHVLR